MTHQPSPLKYMGTQSRETMALAEAMAHDTGADVAAPRSKVGQAASWAMDTAKDGLQSAAGQVRERATAAVSTYTREDPIRAILIAAGAGALLMSVLAMMARSGARTVRRNVRR